MACIGTDQSVEVAKGDWDHFDVVRFKGNILHDAQNFSGVPSDGCIQSTYPIFKQHPGVYGVSIFLDPLCGDAS